MRTRSLARRSVALVATTALLTGGLTAGLAAPAWAAGSITSFSPTSWDSRSTVTMTINGTDLPAGPTTQLFPDQVLFTPVVPDGTNEAAQFWVTAEPGNTATSLTVEANLSMAPAGEYTIQVADGQKQNLTPPAAQKFTVYAFGSANVTDVLPGGSTGSTSRSNIGGTPLDIKGSNIAIGAKVRFLKAGDTPDTLAFQQHDPNQPSNNLDTQDADGVTGSGYISSTLLRGNYTYPADVSGQPGFAPGFHKLQIVNKGDTAPNGTTVDFAQPWYAATGALSPAGVAKGASNVVVTVTGQGIRAGSRLEVAKAAGEGTSCNPVTVGTATVSAPDGNGTYTKISAPVSISNDGCVEDQPRTVTIAGPDGARFARAETSAMLDTIVPGPAPQPRALTSGFEVLGQGAHVGFGAEIVDIQGTNFVDDDAHPGEQGDPTKMTTFSYGDGVTVKTIYIGDGFARVSIDVADGAPTGDRTVTATNPDGGVGTWDGDDGDDLTNPLGDPPPLTITAGPRVTKVSQPSLQPATTPTITLTGTFNPSHTYAVKLCLHGTTLDCADDPKINESPSQATPNDDGTTLTFSVSVQADASRGPRDLAVTDTTDHGRVYCPGCMGVDTLALSGTSTSVPNTAPKSITFTDATGIDQVTSASTATLTRLVPLPGQGTIPLAPGTTLTPGSPGSNTASGTFDFTGVAPGQYSITVVKDPGAASPTTWNCTGCLTVTADAITVTGFTREPGAHTPPTGGQGASDLVLKLVGTNFSKGMQVTIDDVTVEAVTRVSNSELRVQVDIAPDAPPGDDKVVKIIAGDGVGPGTGSSVTKTFTVTPKPTPSGAPAPAAYGQGAGSAGYIAANPGSTITVTVSGDDFQNDATLSLGPDIDVTSPTVTQGSCSIELPGCTPSKDTLAVTVAVHEDAAVGKRDVVVRNGDGGAGTLAQGFTVNGGPKVLSVANAGGAPVLLPDGVAHPITVSGSGFTSSPASTLKVVPADGVTIDPSKVVVTSSGTMTAEVKVETSAALGTRSVGVTNPSDKGFGSLTPVYVAKAPGVPGSLKLTPGGGSLTATWTPSAPNGAPVTQYQVTIQRVGSTSVGASVVSGTTLTKTLTGLTNGVSYVVRVAAVNVAGKGLPASATGIAGVVTKLTSGVSTKLTTAGSSVRFSGKLVAGTAPVANRVLALRFKPAVGSAFTKFVRTNTAGGWAYVYPTKYTFRMGVSFAGDAIYRATAASSIPVSVRAKVARTSPTNGSTSSAATTLRITGYVYPNKRGKYVYLYRYVSGTRTLLARATLSSTSTYTFVLKPRRGSYTMRVFIANTTGNLANYGPAFTIKRV